jgi:cell division protein FtsL
VSVGAVPRARLTGRAAGLAAIVLLLALSLIFPIRQFLAQRAEIRELETQVQELARERQVLEAKVARLRDPEHLERIARQCLGMVRPGEIAFIAVPEDGGPPVEGC